MAGRLEGADKAPHTRYSERMEVELLSGVVICIRTSASDIPLVDGQFYVPLREGSGGIKLRFDWRKTVTLFMIDERSMDLQFKNWMLVGAFIRSYLPMYAARGGS